MANYVLEILDGDRAGDVLPVGDAVLRIGRKSGNDLVLADEKTSGVHCEIAPEADRLVLKDLGSTNGTFLDGKRITEVVLTPGDVVTVGRLRVKFRAEGDDAAAADDAGEFSLRKLDAARLQRKGSPVGLLVVLLLVLGGGGGYWWWMQQGEAGNGSGPRSPRQREALSVSGNLLIGAIGACESEEGWLLRAAGAGFRAARDAHTGSGSFAAYRTDESDGDAGGARSKDDYAMLTLAEPLQVFAGRTFTVAAHGRTSGAGMIGVRAVCYAANEDMPFRFVSGTELAARDGWGRMETAVTVPDACDRLQLEVVAVLPDDASEAYVDDLAVTEGGAANGVKVKLDSGLSAWGFGAAVALRSADPQNPATVLGLAPGAVPDALRGLHAAGLTALSDVGGAVQLTAEGAAFEVQASGVDGLAYVLPVASGDSLLAAGAKGDFSSMPAVADFSAQQVLFGGFGTRGMLRFDAETQVRGELAGDSYRLVCGAPSAQLVVGFRAERQESGRLVRESREAHAAGRPGDALGLLDEVFSRWPMDSAQLGEAQQLRTQILGEQAAAAQQLAQEFEEAGFFDTRGGYERVVEGVDALIALYGEDHVEGLDAQRALRAKAGERLSDFDRTTFKAQRERLQLLADAFAAASEPELEKLVKDYIEKHLPATEDGAGEGGRD